MGSTSLDETPSDPEREYQRQMLAGACGQGDGSACYELGNMYGEDGNEFAKTKLWEKACGLGYLPACSASEKGKSTWGERIKKLIKH